MSTLRAPIDIRIHDSHFGIWQDDPNDETFRREVFGGLIREMRTRGWKIKADPKCMYASMRPGMRLAIKGTLRAEVQCFGRSMKVEYWSETAIQSNRNGRRYDYDKMQRMSYLDRLRVQLEMRRMTVWLEAIAPITVSSSDTSKLSPIQKIEKSYAESVHKDKDLGRPVCKDAYNCISADRQSITHGNPVWFTDDKGRFLRGTAYYNIGGMWWVVNGSSGRRNMSSRELYAYRPEKLRMKQNARLRRGVLERLLKEAIQKMDFLRAETLKQILFGDKATYAIWHKEHGAYYRENCSGYSTDLSGAGRYTKDEAIAQVKSAPHLLEAVMFDGARVELGAAA